MLNDDKLKLRLTMMTRRFQFDRVFSFIFVFVGILLQSPVVLFAGALFFLLTALDAFLKNRLEKHLHGDSTPTPES